MQLIKIIFLLFLLFLTAICVQASTMMPQSKQKVRVRALLNGRAAEAAAAAAVEAEAVAAPEVAI